MARQILKKLRVIVAGLGVVGASVFTAAPMDGCDGTLNIVVEGVGFGDDYGYDDGSVDWQDDWNSPDDEFDSVEGSTVELL